MLVGVRRLFWSLLLMRAVTDTKIAMPCLEFMEHHLRTLTQSTRAKLHPSTKNMGPGPKQKKKSPTIFSNFQQRLNALVAQYHPGANQPPWPNTQRRVESWEGAQGGDSTQQWSFQQQQKQMRNSDLSGFTHSSFVIKAIKFISRQLNLVMCNTIMKYSVCWFSFQNIW